MHINYHHSPHLPLNQTPEHNPEGFPLLVTVDIYHYILAFDILTRPDESYLIPFIPRYFNFIQMANMGLILQSPYLNMYISQWYAEPRDLTFLFTFHVRFTYDCMPVGTVQPSILALDPSLQWLYRKFRAMVAVGLPSLEALIVLVREEMLLQSHPVLRVLHRGRFHNVYINGATFNCPIYPQLLFNRLTAIDITFGEYHHETHFSRSHITCGLCNRDHPRLGVHSSVFSDSAATELAILPCCFTVVHPTCMLSLIELLATRNSRYHYSLMSWRRHPFLQNFFGQHRALFPKPAPASPPLPRHTCPHCHLTMDLNLLLLLGRNMEHAFQPAIHSSNGEVVQPTMPIMRRGAHYNLLPLQPQFPPLFQNFYALLLHIYRRTNPVQLGSNRAAPTLHSLAPSLPPTLREEDFAFPRR